MSNQNHSSPFPSCFRPSSSSAAAATHHHHHPTAAPPPISGNPNLATSLYHTHLGLFALTWSRHLLGRSLHLHLLLHTAASAAAALSTPSFHLHLKPFLFWNKHGHRKLNTTTEDNSIQIFWDLSRAKFGSGPEPLSGFYIAVVADGHMALLVGDSPDEAYSKSRAPKSNPQNPQIMVLRREHVYGNKSYTTTATFGGKTREISIDCGVGDDDDHGLSFSIDKKKVLEIRHLKWKFRGNERIEINGANILISWDVYNWLFEDDHDQDGYALFMFKFEKLGFLNNEEDEEEEEEGLNQSNVLWSHQYSSCGFGYERKKMRKKKGAGGLLRSTGSSSSSSLSSASSSCSSVMEWASTEENELKDPSGFCLLVYAWKKN